MITNGEMFEEIQSTKSHHYCVVVTYASLLFRFAIVATYLPNLVI